MDDNEVLNAEAAVLEDGEEEYEEDSDEDIEIVMDTAQAKPAAAPINIKTTSTAAAADPAAAAAASAAAAALAGTAKSNALDINAVGQVDGKDLFDLDVDSIEDKPWRKPGADITDYFNFGFNETTWRAYCTKQKALREEALMQKRIHVFEHNDQGFGNNTDFFGGMMGMQQPKFQRMQQQQQPQFNPMMQMQMQQMMQQQRGMMAPGMGPPGMGPPGMGPPGMGPPPGMMGMNQGPELNQFGML
ncbi:Fip1-domain-containing protein [Rhizoclosmatium globosum]|uniref:Fip1-domain-containing protein n=1 Tax=Rhizoclosmatium globosum TaxID=329046 RepID=A0A1Y2C692_9FUNG|nr:Fip1-domain-containing protein [Rhizoclosmatium globosum]|eukprot:ORY42563.1 Fip1-domain-containing protein [Rhizoclosmatium globosum]